MQVISDVGKVTKFDGLKPANFSFLIRKWGKIKKQYETQMRLRLDSLSKKILKPIKAKEVDLEPSFVND